MTDTSTPEFDYGQAEIGAFLQRARDGQFNFANEPVGEVVAQLDSRIDELVGVRKSLGAAEIFQGFGGFDSSKELQQGFTQKAAEGREVLTQLITGLLDIQEAFLRAAGKFTEVDTLNQKRLQLAGSELPA